VRRVQRSVFGQFINVTACDRCRGEGLIIPTPCSSCKGSGRERFTRTIEVKIPAGVDNGSQIRLSGEGELGSFGGPRGNVYVLLDVDSHEFFEREEDDLHLQLNINFAQAALGDEIEVPTLEGTTHKLSLKAGTQSGEIIVLRQKGIQHLRGNGRGDMFVHVQVETPKKLSSEQKKLLQQLADTMEDSDEGGGKGLFARVKDALS
jgi:molecular chaperone DnaJ